jgi:hypothetical protein
LGKIKYWRASKRVLFAKHYTGNQIKEDEMGETKNTGEYPETQQLSVVFLKILWKKNNKFVKLQFNRDWDMNIGTSTTKYVSSLFLIKHWQKKNHSFRVKLDISVFFQPVGLISSRPQGISHFANSMQPEFLKAGYDCFSPASFPVLYS